MQKVLEYDEGKFIIGYCDNSQDISIFENGDYTDTIRIEFFPKGIMNEKTCSDYTDKFIEEVINEAKILIQENNEFYENFEINFYSEFTGYIFVRNTITRELIVQSSSLNVISKLKNDIVKII